MHHVTKITVSGLHRQGKQWVPVIYDPRVDTWREYGPMGYFLARDMVRQARAEWNTRKQDYDALP